MKHRYVYTCWEPVDVRESRHINHFMPNTALGYRWTEVSEMETYCNLTWSFHKLSASGVLGQKMRSNETSGLA